MKVSFIWRMVSACLLGFALGVFITTAVLVPHLKPEVTISQIYKRKVKVSDQGTLENTMNVEDVSVDDSEVKNKKNRVRRRDRR